MAETSDLKMTAEPTAMGDSCRFIMESDLYENAAGIFPDRESTKGSPLAEMLFAIDGVAHVTVTPRTVTVSIGKPEADWREMGKKIADTIRAHHVSGQPAVSDAMLGSPVKDIEISKKVQGIIDAEINPGVASHGGIISLLDVKNSQVYLQMGGGCQGCGMANVTLKQGIETILRERIPEVVGIVDQTDHAGGTNPYYQPGK